MARKTLRPVAIIGGVRTPFCRANSAYAELSNLDLLSGALQGLSARFGLKGELIDEVIAGAVISHSRDWNLAREALQSTDLSSLSPGITLQQACGTSLQAAMLSAGKIASGQIECAIAAGTEALSDPPIVFGKRFSQRLLRLQQARSVKDKLRALKGFGFSELAPQPPAVAEARTFLSMGQHCELMAQQWGISRAEQDALAAASHRKTAAAYDAGFFDELIVPCAGMLRDNILRADTSEEKLAALKTCFERGERATLTAGNSTSLTDGAAAVLLGSEAWAKKRGLPVLGYLTEAQTAAVDYVSGEGLLMGPTVAVSQMLNRAKLSLQDFEFYEIHEAFAAQVACTLKAWESADYCRDRLGRDEPLGAIDAQRMNVKGSSLAVGHPFAATGARILATLVEILAEAGGGRGLVSVCTAGGMGVAAVVER